jgi:hypothetical protein
LKTLKRTEQSAYNTDHNSRSIWSPENPTPNAKSKEAPKCERTTLGLLSVDRIRDDDDDDNEAKLHSLRFN